MTAVELRDIYRARVGMAGIARRTPLVHSAGLSAHTGAEVYLKLENQQETGSFKVRGAANFLVSMEPAARARGVVTVSTGNHGRAVAYVARRLGMRAVVCVPRLVLPHKVEAIRRLGAEVRVRGADQDEAEAYARQIADQDGLALVSPFDDPKVIAGQGVIGVELLEELPDVDTVIVPLSGGGLIGGIGVALKAASPQIRLVGVSMARGPVMVRSLEAGRPVQLPEEETLADSLMGGIGLENRYTFDLVRRVVDETALLSEEEIAAAMVYALRQERQIVEGGGAVALGALLHDKIDVAGQRVAVVVSGGNVDLERLARLLNESWAAAPAVRNSD
ncbi:MAG TPA: hydroxyectoine utilization dehydratase EutB [Caldilineaceae bacterium]|nr:hydroxyectoine utilization dehydratase EutB [Caldilineaceae bacterium]